MFLIDANILIEAKNRYYAFDLAPGFWEWLWGAYQQEALTAFTAAHADYLLIAYASAHGHTVVTHERPSPQSKKRILIPDACAAMGVKTVDTFHMMRECGVTLGLRTAA